MSRDHSRHGEMVMKGRVIRADELLPSHNPRNTDPYYLNKMRAKLATDAYLRAKGEQPLTDAEIKTYVDQFDALSAAIRKVVVGTDADPGISPRTPLRIRRDNEHGAARPGRGYFCLEWRIKLVNSTPSEDGCGCACGCGCGG